MMGYEEGKILNMAPAAELEDVIDGAGNMTVWVAQYESYRFQFMATGLTSYSAHCALVQGLRDHAKQYQLVDHWFISDDITVTRMTMGQTLRDREVIRV